MELAMDAVRQTMIKQSCFTLIVVTLLYINFSNQWQITHAQSASMKPKIEKTQNNTFCLCPDDLFYRKKIGNCSSWSDLKELNIQSGRGTDHINISWIHPQDLNIRYSVNAIDIHMTLKGPGATISPLSPGTNYLITIMYVLRLPDEWFCIKKTFNHSTQIYLWTRPASAGNITSISTPPDEHPPSSDYTFTIMFNASIGNVSRYEMVIDGIGKCNGGTSVATFTCGPLTPGKHYNYNITTYNGNNDGNVNSRILITPATKASHVMNVLINEAATSARINWSSPHYPNGIISHYALSANAADGRYECIRCFSCQSPEAVDNTNCYSSSKNKTTCATLELNGDCKMFSVQLVNLQPWTNYSVNISAVNQKGRGQITNNRFETKIGAANLVTGVELSSARDSTTNLIKLTIRWIPGNCTGPTFYNITVEEETNYSSNMFIILNQTEEITTTNIDINNVKAYWWYKARVYAYTKVGGKDWVHSKGHQTAENKITTTNIDINNVKAYWWYKVRVYAYTKVGGTDWVQSKGHQTAENNPGVVQNLVVAQDPTDAQTFTVKFNCLDANESNGAITGYTIKQTLLYLDGEVESDTLHDVNAMSCTNSYYTLSGVEVERNYKFAVMARNTKYNGSFSDSEPFTFQPRKPQILKKFSVSTIIRKNTLLKNDDMKVAMTICGSCLLNSNQGNVLEIGLIVCVKSDSSQCNITDPTYADFITWKKARDLQFVDPYRTTRDDWIENLHSEPSDTNFTVGVDVNCDADPVDHFCNGPLPAGRIITISVIVCTQAGCDLVSTEETFMTKDNCGGKIVLSVPEDKENTDSNVTTAVVLIMLALAIIACLVVLFVFRKKLRCFSKESKIQEPEISRNRPIKMRKFEDHVNTFHKDSNLLFQAEFECIRNLCMEFKTSCNEAQREANRIKNRYVDILPYDHSRIKLNVQPEDDETNDFINANYIPGYNSVREYIAAQGPMNCTVSDFWRMAWEQKCHIIVMLSDLQENGKLKVDQYWPEHVSEPISYENVVVELTNFSQLTKYVIRNFKISKGEEVRKVTQFFLPGWWDFSANLSFDDVLEFVKLVRQEVNPETSGPIIVHCSAGVGRTGTMIALDYFIQYVDKHSLDDHVDIFDYVLQMRKNRPRMVQAEGLISALHLLCTTEADTSDQPAFLRSQYIFIFDAVLEIIKKKIESEKENLPQSRGSSADANIEQNHVVAMPVNIQVEDVNIQVENVNIQVDDKYVCNNGAVETGDSKQAANEAIKQQTSEL